MSHEQFDGGAGILGWAALAAVSFLAGLLTVDYWLPFFAVLVL
jgi:hypothetical protein